VADDLRYTLTHGVAAADSGTGATVVEYVLG
jgi:hypothetical protein